MIEKVITKIPKHLYHLSDKNNDGVWFKPRIPESIAIDMSGFGDEYEDTHTKRVCFSTSISKAFFAISFDGSPEELYVHIPENLDKIVERRKLCKPTEEQVFDVSTTNEHWIKCKVKMKCIGKIKIRYRSYWGVVKTSFKWIEKY